MLGSIEAFYKGRVHSINDCTPQRARFRREIQVLGEGDGNMSQCFSLFKTDNLKPEVLSQNGLPIQSQFRNPKASFWVGGYGYEISEFYKENDRDSLWSIRSGFDQGFQKICKEMNWLIDKTNPESGNQYKLEDPDAILKILGMSDEELAPYFKHFNPRYDLSEKPWLIRQMAAIYIARSIGVVAPGSSYSLKRLRWEASLLGAELKMNKTLYRFDRRSPDEIKSAGGFLPNPSSPSFTLWEHVIKENISGSLVSLTTEQGNRQVRTMVADANFRGDGNATTQTLPKEVYEYKVVMVSGVETPARFGIAGEKEVISNKVKLSQISEYRIVTVDRYSNAVLAESEWRAF